jgi:hypothetical protein
MPPAGSHSSSSSWCLDPTREQELDNFQILDFDIARQGCTAGHAHLRHPASARCTRVSPQLSDAKDDDALWICVDNRESHGPGFPSTTAVAAPGTLLGAQTQGNGKGELESTAVDAFEARGPLGLHWLRGDVDGAMALDSTWASTRWHGPLKRLTRVCETLLPPSPTRALPFSPTTLPPFLCITAPQTAVPSSLLSCAPMAATR